MTPLPLRKRHGPLGIEGPLLVLAGSVGIAGYWHEPRVLYAGAALTALVCGLVTLIKYSRWARLTLTDAGVALPSVRRVLFIPWTDLRSVEPAGRWPSVIRWRRTDGSVELMSDAFDLDRLLTEIRRRAPHVECSIESGVEAWADPPPQQRR